MTELQKQQAEHWLKEFTKLANGFWSDNNSFLYEYWKGQVMGIAKVLDLIGSGIDTRHYLNKLP